MSQLQTQFTKHKQKADAAFSALSETKRQFENATKSERIKRKNWFASGMIKHSNQLIDATQAMEEIKKRINIRGRYQIWKGGERCCQKNSSRNLAI